MNITLGKRLLRLVDPAGEKQRMEMRRLRCMVEANAEDLTRTIATSSDKIKDMVDRAKSEKEGT
jgi:hypothetical protein